MCIFGSNEKKMAEKEPIGLRKGFAVAGAVLLCCIAMAPIFAQTSSRTIHVFVALADNQNQGIIPVPAKLGNGEDPDHNLYWGAAFGVKTFFLQSAEWKLLACYQKPKSGVLERCVFKHRTQNVYLVTDAYEGSQIRQATVDFLNATAGVNPEKISVTAGVNTIVLNGGGGADLVAYVGHDGLMDFQLATYPEAKNQNHRDAIILACASKPYFDAALRASGAYPLLWTSNLMAPEAYTLKSAIDGWILNESHEQIRERAAEAYHQYQKCSLAAARALLVSGW
jgi:hypothetical protein